MNRLLSWQTKPTGNKMELEEVISRRLAGYGMAAVHTLSEQPAHQPGDLASESTVMACHESDKPLEMGESATQDKWLEGIPPRVSITQQEEDNSPQRLQKAKVEQVESHHLMLPGYSASKATAGLPSSSPLSHEEKDSKAKIITIHQDKDDAVPDNQTQGTAPLSRPAPVDKVAFFKALQHNEVKILRNRFGNLLSMFLTMMLTGAVVGAYFVAKHYRQNKGPESYLRAEMVEGKKVVIKTNRGLPLAELTEHNGVVFFEICDSSGKPRASVSLGADNEVKFGLYDQGQHKIKEWSGEKANTPEAAPSDKPTDPSPSTTSANLPKGEMAPKYIGSKTSNKYHYPDCKWAKQIKPERVLGFNSVKEAKEQDYVQCPTCQPPLNISSDN